MKYFSAPRYTVRACTVCLISLIALPVAAPAYVGKWHSFTNKERITSLIEHDGQVYAGTQGGIRRIDPVNYRQWDFNNLDGLLDVWITGLARDSAGTLWAVSRKGFVHALSPNGRRWEARGGGSYAAQNWRMNDRAVLAAGKHLFLGAFNGLAVFDTEQKVSQLNLTRFRDAIDVSVLSLLRRDDTLYVGTEAGVFKAPVDFEDPLNPREGFATLADHNQWIAVDQDTTGGANYAHLAFVGDSLATFGPGTLLQEPVRVEAFADTGLVIGSQVYPPSMYGFVAAVHVAGRVFAGGQFDLIVSENPGGSSQDAQYLRSERWFPRDTVANIGANRGNAILHSPGGLTRLEPGYTFNSQPSAVQTGSYELHARFLRNAVLDDNGDIYIGSWGGGLVRVRNGESTVWKTEPASCNFYQLQTDPTMDTTWTVVHSISRPQGNNLYFTIFKGEDGSGHQLVHLNLQSDVITCLNDNAPGNTPHAVHAFSDTLLGIATNDGLVLYKTRQGAVAPLLESMGVWTVSGSGNQAWDLTTDQWERPWALFASGLAYLDSLDISETRRLGFVDNFIGENCRSLEADPAGLLWVGCDNGLFHIQTEPSGELGQVRRYGVDDGLLSLFIYDVNVDPANGRVWVATDRGVSMFESASLPTVPEGRLVDILPYPNPFRPHHQYVILDNLPSNATVRIHSPTGNVVRIFHPRDLLGSRAQWDGRNESGRRVAAGVYTYSVSSGSNVVHGKIIVAR